MDIHCFKLNCFLDINMIDLNVIAEINWFICEISFFREFFFHWFVSSHSNLKQKKKNAFYDIYCYLKY